MGRTQINYIDDKNIYCCKKCGSHLTTYRQLLSKAFTGQTGTAYLFNNV